MQTVLTVYFGAGLMKLVVHGVVDNVSRKTSLLTLVLLLLLHPHNKQDLEYDHTPKDAPNGQNSLEGINLNNVSHKIVTKYPKR